MVRLRWAFSYAGSSDHLQAGAAGSSGSTDFTEVQQLAEHSGVFTRDRIPVIFYESEYVLDPFGDVRDAISNGCGYQPSPGRGFAMINI